MQSLQRRMAHHGPLYAGLLAGFIGLVVSFLFEGLIPARPLGDPMPLMLAFNQLLRGFLYYQWRPPLFHLLFAVSLGLLAVALLRWSLRSAPAPDQAQFAGRVAAVINVGVVAALSTDALVIAFWYLLSGLLSVLITGFVAGRAARVWARR